VAVQSAINVAAYSADITAHLAPEELGVPSMMRLPLERAPPGSVLQHMASVASNAVADLAFAASCGGSTVHLLVWHTLPLAHPLARFVSCAFRTDSVCRGGSHYTAPSPYRSTLARWQLTPLPLV
jgi:hypothetical protein